LIAQRAFCFISCSTVEIFSYRSSQCFNRIKVTAEPLPQQFTGQFYRYHQALYQNTELPVTLADSRAALELITALYHSAETGQAVELPIGTDHPKYTGWQPQ
jgi:predicted dehydrogenase